MGKLITIEKQGDFSGTKYIDLFFVPVLFLTGLKSRRKYPSNSYRIAEFILPPYLSEEDDDSINIAIEEIDSLADFVSCSNDEKDEFVSILTSGIGKVNECTGDILLHFETFLQDRNSIFYPKIIKYLFHGLYAKNWYVKMNKAVEDFLPDYDKEVFLKIFAMTSPRTDFQSNLRLAISAYKIWEKGGKFTSGFFPPTIKMLSDFQNGDFLFDGNERNGRRKVTQFYKALMGDKDSVVVDTWIMESVGLIRHYEHNGKIVPHKPRVHEYDFIESYILTLADIASYEPRQVISMLWAGSRICNGKSKLHEPEEIFKNVIPG